ncbi:MAG TPA: oligoendopeptidase F [Vicinamibacterales bacterium]|nr:oligoendopeptidase F [Vicinamibacterales bacterium]
MATETPVEQRMRAREEIPEAFTWNLSDIYPSWADWEQGLSEFERKLSGYAELRGTFAQGSGQLLKAFQLEDELGQLSYKLWYYAGLTYDQDQRDNAANGRRQRVQILFAKAAEARSWFTPELLRIPLETVRGWMASHQGLAVYRFAIERVYHQQEHVLDEKGEHLLSLSSRFGDTPHDVHSMLANADIKHPTITLHDGRTATLTYGQYNALLQTNRHQPDRASAFQAFHETFASNANTYAAVYNGVLQHDWFIAQARQFKSTLEGALHGNDIPPAVVENLVATAKAGTEPLRRYHRLRKRVLGLETYHAYDQLVPLIDCDRKYEYSEVLDVIVEAMKPLGPEYQKNVRAAFEGRWIDVYENPGKRSGAYSAPVYGVHPYMLLNYNDTLDSVFTLVHELGHSMHTMLSEAHQPFVYSDYTIFVAEVPSTLSEMLFFDHMLSRTSDQRERIVLLQHAIDDIVGTFYRQCLFADYELQAHRLAEQGEPITAETLSRIYFDLFKAYHGDVMTYDEVAKITWARVPHFFGSPYYVYQYATCYASSAQLIQTMTSGSDVERREGVDRFLNLLRAGGSDYPMELLKRAGIDLSTSAPAEAVVKQLDRRVSQLEAEIEKLP